MKIITGCFVDPEKKQRVLPTHDCQLFKPTLPMLLISTPVTVYFNAFSKLTCTMTVRWVVVPSPILQMRKPCQSYRVVSDRAGT